MERGIRIKAIAAVVLILGMLSTARATIVELPLDCAGLYDVNSSPWSTSFDLGVAFTDISHVYMDWSGEITGGLGVYWYDPNNPFPMDVGIGTFLGNPPDWRHIIVQGGETTYPDPEPFDHLSEFVYGGMPWSELFDGQGTTTIEYKEAIIAEGWYVEHGSVTLDSATLVVDGTIVPEPATFLLLAIGALGLNLS